MHEIKNILTDKEIKELLNYNETIDDRSDVRPDVASKHPRWDIDQWPQHIIRKVLNKVLDYDYEVEEVIFNKSKISFRIHADSGKSDIDRQGHAVLIPLKTDGPSHTVFFDNHWHFNSTKFSKVDISPFQYQLPNKNGNWITIQDIRCLLEDLKTRPESIKEFDVTEEFINEIENLVAVRNNKGISKVDNRCYDYSLITNYDKNYVIDIDIYNQYLSHIDYETVKGLKIEKIAEWNINNAMVFPRTQIHCASSSHKEKVGVTIFVRPRLS